MRISIPLGILALALLAAPLAAAPPDNLSEANKLVAVGRYYAAEKVLEARTEKAPDDHALWARLAEVRLDMPGPDLKGAEDAIFKALELVEDKNGAYWKIWGRISFAKGDEALRNRASANAIKSHFADAEVRFKEARKLTPDDPELLWLLAWAKELQEYPVEAEELYKDQLVKFPKEIGGYRRYGAMISNRANQTGGGTSEEAGKIRAKALELFDKGLETAGPDAETYYLRGLALEWAKKGDEAKESYRQAVRTDPDFEKAWRRLLDLRVPAADIQALAMEVLKKHKQNGTAALWAGWSLTNQGEVKKAMELMLPALEVHREHYGLWYQASAAAGKVYQNRATQAATIPWYEKIHEYYEFSGAAANNLGFHYRETGNFAESLKWYVRALEREPNDQNTLNDTALMYLFHFTGAEQKKCLPLLEKCVGLVFDEGQKPDRGFWDALENLCKYYWEVDRQPEMVIKYGSLRNKPYEGVAPYAPSRIAPGYVRRAEEALGR